MPQLMLVNCPSCYIICTHKKYICTNLKANISNQVNAIIHSDKLYIKIVHKNRIWAVMLPNKSINPFDCSCTATPIDSAIKRCKNEKTN